MDEVELVKGDRIVHRNLIAERAYRVKRYDFKRPDKFSAEQIRTICFVHETFCRLATPTLSSAVGAEAEVKVTLVDQCTISEHLDHTEPGSAFALLGVKPLDGPMLVQLTLEPAEAVVNGLCGGRKTPVESCGLGPLDTVVLAHAVECVLPDLKSAWSNIVDLQPDVKTVETDHRQLQIAAPSEMIVLVTLGLTVGGTAGHIRFIIPYLTIEPVIGRLRAQYWYLGPGKPPRERPVNLDDVPLAAEVVFPTEALALSALRDVRAGLPVHLPGAGGARLVLGGAPVALVRDSADAALSKRRGTYVFVRGVTHGVSGVEHDEKKVLPEIRALIERVDRLSGDVRALSDSQRVLSEDLVHDRGEPSSGPGLDTVTVAHAAGLAQVLCTERAQVIAFVLGLLPDAVSAAVIAAVPEDRRPDIVERLVKMVETDRILERRVSVYLAGFVSRPEFSRTLGGPDRAARILNHVPRSIEKHVMETFVDRDTELFESIARLMFVFQDFVLVDPVAIRKLMARIDVNEMALAMKDVEHDVCDHIIGALDEDAARALTSALSSVGRVRRRDVEAAQRDLIEELRQLEAAGEVVVARPDEMLE